MSSRRVAYFAEIRSQIALALPAFLAQIAMVSMGFVDMVMTGKVGAIDMAAVALAGSLWLPIILFGQGILLSITPSVAQLRGAAASGVGQVFRQGLWLAFGISMPLMWLTYKVSFHLQDFGVEPQLAALTKDYLQYIMWGAPGFLLFVALRCGLEGMGLMRPAMFAGFLGLAVNIPCNYVFIFGKLGLPALGGPGTGVATAIVYWIMFLTVLSYALRHHEVRHFLALKQWEAPLWATLKRLCIIGFPGAMAMLFEVTLFALVAILIAPFGALMVAGHQIALNFSSLLFMIPLSLGMAATIRTGYGLGQRDAGAVCVASRTALGLACCSACMTALITVLWRGQIAAIYNDNPEVLALATHLLLFAATYQLTDGLQVVSVGILRGYNDTRAIFGVTFLTYWVIALPLGYTLGRTSLWGDPMGAQGFWIAFIVGISLSAILFILRVRVLERRLNTDPSRIKSLRYTPNLSN